METWQQWRKFNSLALLDIAEFLIIWFVTRRGALQPRPDRLIEQKSYLACIFIANQPFRGGLAPLQLARGRVRFFHVISSREFWDEPHLPVTNFPNDTSGRIDQNRNCIRNGTIANKRIIINKWIADDHRTPRRHPLVFGLPCNFDVPLSKCGSHVLTNTCH